MGRGVQAYHTRLAPALQSTNPSEGKVGFVEVVR